MSEPFGSEPGFRRPIVVVQSDNFNRSRIKTVIGVILTSNLRLADAPGNVLIPKAASGLPKDSVANVSQIITRDRSYLTRHERILPPLLLQEIGRGLKLALDL
jgi:mRNA interferase MazF